MSQTGQPLRPPLTLLTLLRILKMMVCCVDNRGTVVAMGPCMSVYILYIKVHVQCINVHHPCVNSVSVLYTFYVKKFFIFMYNVHAHVHLHVSYVYCMYNCTMNYIVWSRATCTCFALIPACCHGLHCKCTCTLRCTCTCPYSFFSFSYISHLTHFVL